MNKMISRTVSQKNLTSECWLVQIWGEKSCQTCEFKGKRECGGKKIRKSGKNEKGLDVPIN
jgi:hypothetical protein